MHLALNWHWVKCIKSWAKGPEQRTPLPLWQFSFLLASQLSFSYLFFPGDLRVTYKLPMEVEDNYVPAHTK